MEKSNIKKMDYKYLKDIGLKEEDINQISVLINQGIKEQLYTKTKIPYHNIKHIEKVMIYCVWILNKQNNPKLFSNKELLLLAALYHDAGRSKGASNKNHGIVGAEIAREKLVNTLGHKNLDIIELLIKTHATKSDQVDFTDKNFEDKERDIIQELSNILKDADALDRNRIKLFKFAQCKQKFLRTKEAQAIFLQSNELLNKYETAYKL